MLYGFGGFELDLQRCELRQAGNLIQLEPLVLRVLTMYPSLASLFY